MLLLLDSNRMKNSLIQKLFICYWIPIGLLLVCAFLYVSTAIVLTVQLLFKYTSLMRIAEASCYCVAIDCYGNPESNRIRLVIKIGADWFRN